MENNLPVLTASERDLLTSAISIVEKAYAPYSGFHVGCAVRCDSNKMYLGVNCENASYGGTICAERAAALNAVSSGERRIVAIAVAAGTSPTPPCGICRQFLSEFCDSDTLVIFASSDGSCYQKLTFGEIFPHSFSKNNLT